MKALEKDVHELRTTKLKYESGITENATIVGNFLNHQDLFGIKSARKPFEITVLAIE